MGPVTVGDPAVGDCDCGDGDDFDGIVVDGSVTSGTPSLGVEFDESPSATTIFAAVFVVKSCDTVRDPVALSCTVAVDPAVDGEMTIFPRTKVTKGQLNERDENKIHEKFYLC